MRSGERGGESRYMRLIYSIPLSETTSCVPGDPKVGMYVVGALDHIKQH